jgi:hypothetical protein
VKNLGLRVKGTLNPNPRMSSNLENAGEEEGAGEEVEDLGRGFV